MSTTPRLLMSLLLYIFVANKRKSWIIHFFIHFASVFIGLSTSKSLNALDVIAVHSCKRLPDEKTGNNNLFLTKWNPMSFFFLFVGSYKVGKLNVSTSSGNLFACKQGLYSEPFRSVQEIKVLTSFGQWVKKPEGGDCATFWLESENLYKFKACVLEFSDRSRGTAEIN